MAQLQSFKRIIIEDFEAEDRNLVNKLANSINGFADEVLSALNKNLTVGDNLNINYKSINIMVDSNGRPLTTTTFQTGVSGLSMGLTVIKVVNRTTGSTATPSGTPFITYSENNGIITVVNITHLPPNVLFSVQILILA